MNSGRVPDGTGLSQAEPQEGLGPSGFDPSRDKPYGFDEMADPILRAIRFSYNLERKNRRRNVPWDGLSLGKNMRATSPDFKERLRARNLAYAEEDQGRDALEEIVGIALQVGIEQGRRIAMTGNEVQLLVIKLTTASVGLKRLGSMEAFTLSRIIDPEADKELLARIEYARKLRAVLE